MVECGVVRVCVCGAVCDLHCVVCLVSAVHTHAVRVCACACVLVHLCVHGAREQLRIRENKKEN